jgi:agmatinase
MSAHLPYSGIATFARAAHQDLFATWQSDVAVLGIPFDLALGFRPGARFAPRALREASLRYALSETGFFDMFSGKHKLAGTTLTDAGDVLLPSLEPELARVQIEQAARVLRQKARLPVFLGGDHSISYSVLKAFDDVPNLHVVQFDAHLDFSDIRNQTKFSNSSPFRRACEEMDNLVQITTIGLRGLRFDAEAVAAAKARGHRLLPVCPPDAALLPRGQNVYVSFDTDVLEPSLIPATSSPEPEGMGFAAALEWLSLTAQHNTIVGFDLVEFAPNLDPTGNSGLYLARLIMEFLAMVNP